LKLIDNRKGYLGLSRVDDNIAPTACDNWYATFFSHGD